MRCLEWVDDEWDVVAWSAARRASYVVVVVGTRVSRLDNNLAH